MHILPNRFLSAALCVTLTLSGMPTQGIAESVIEPSPSAEPSPLITMQDAGTSNASDALRAKADELISTWGQGQAGLDALWDALCAVDVSEDERPADEAALAALEGTPSTRAGMTQAFVIVATKLGFDAREVKDEQGAPLVCLALGEETLTFNVSSGTSDQRPWATADDTAEKPADTTANPSTADPDLAEEPAAGPEEAPTTGPEEAPAADPAAAPTAGPDEEPTGGPNETEASEPKAEVPELVVPAAETETASNTPSQETPQTPAEAATPQKESAESAVEKTRAAQRKAESDAVAAEAARSKATAAETASKDSAKANAAGKSGTKSQSMNSSPSLSAQSAGTATKAGNTIQASAKKAKLTVTFNPAKAQTLGANIAVSKAQGKVSYTNVSKNATSKKFSVKGSTGAITIPKGTNAGTYPVIIRVSAAGDASHKAGTKDVSFNVVIAKASISKAAVSAIGNQPYTGKAITPKPTVKYAGVTLKNGTNYALTYKNNTKAGTATVTITGKGNYSGTKSANFKIVAPSIQYFVHRQTYGWEKDWSKSNGQQSGTTGQSKRLEGIKIRLNQKPVKGSIQYKTHVQTYGWESKWKSEGQLSGTTGQRKRLEAIQIKLTGEMAQKYDVYYRVHAQQVGWMAWAKNGASAGTAGFSFRLEAIQIVVLPKGAAAPAATYQGATQRSSNAFLKQTVRNNYQSLRSLGIDYDENVDAKVNGVLKAMSKWCALRGVDYNAGISDYEKAHNILLYVGSHYRYGYDSYDAESMIDMGYGTCFAFSDLVYCMARKVGLVNSWLCIPGRPGTNGKGGRSPQYGSQHRTVVSYFGGKYYDLDGNLAIYGEYYAQPQEISKAYADYLVGKTNSW